MGRLARHVGLLLFLDSWYRVVWNVVRGTGLALVCVRCIQLELRSLVKVSRDETQAGLRSHWMAGSPMVKCGDMDDVGAIDRDWCLGASVRLSAGPSASEYLLCCSNRRVVDRKKCCDSQLAANRKTWITETSHDSRHRRLPDLLSARSLETQLPTPAIFSILRPKQITDAV